MSLTVRSGVFAGYVQTLAALDRILDKAAAEMAERKIAPETILNARLAPDMFTFTRQIQLACDFAKNSAYRLTGAENPKVPDEEKSIDELKARIARTLAMLKEADDAALEAGLAREVTIPRGSGPVTMQGEAYLTRFAVPNFYFHATTAYAILRENGFRLGKSDFLLGVFDA